MACKKKRSTLVDVESSTAAQNKKRFDTFQSNSDGESGISDNKNLKP